MSKKNAATASATATVAELPQILAESAGLPVALEGTWGASEDIDSGDLLVGKIFHQQALSKFVSEGMANAGDWCDSLTGEVLAKRDEPLSIIIFKVSKKLIISKSVLSNGKFEFVESVDVTPDNCNLPWEEETQTGTIKRQLCYNYFCLVSNKINELPYVLSLSSTKIKAAKKINTMIAKMTRMKLSSSSYKFLLTSVKESGEKGTWFGVNVAQGEKCSNEEMLIAYDWYTQIKSKNVVVSEDEHESSYSGTQ